MFVYISVSVSLSICLPICIIIRLPNCLSICLSVCQTIHLRICLSLCPIFLSLFIFYLSVYLSVWLYIYLSVYRSCYFFSWFNSVQFWMYHSYFSIYFINRLYSRTSLIYKNHSLNTCFMIIIYRSHRCISLSPARNGKIRITFQGHNEVTSFIFKLLLWGGEGEGYPDVARILKLVCCIKY